MNWRRQYRRALQVVAEGNAFDQIAAKEETKDTSVYRKCTKNSPKMIKSIMPYAFARNREIYRGIRKLNVFCDPQKYRYEVSSVPISM